MKTKIGNLIFNKNSKLMNKVTTKLMKLAKEFNSIKETDVDAEKRGREIIQASMENTKEWSRLQSEISEMYRIEANIPKRTK